MKWRYDRIFQRVLENRRGNAIIIISRKKTNKKFPKIPESSLIRFVGMSVLCVTLSGMRLSIYVMISSRSTLEKLKDKPKLQFFFVAIVLGLNLYFITAVISGLPNL